MSLRKSQLKPRLGESRRTPEIALPPRKMSGQGFKIVGRDTSPSPLPTHVGLGKDPRRLSPFDQRRTIGRTDFLTQKRDAISRNDKNESKSFGSSFGGPLEQRKRSLKYSRFKRKLFSNSQEEVSLSVKKKSTKILDTPVIEGKRTKSGSKITEDSLRLNKRNYSMRTDNSAKKLQQEDTDMSKKSIGNEQYKNYKTGKNSQEFLYNTMSLATATLDRKDLNASINQRHQKPNGDSSREKANFGASTASTSKEYEKKIPALQTSQDRNSPLIVHKRSNTFNDIFTKKPEPSHGPADGPVSKELSKPLTQTQPIQARRPDSSHSNAGNNKGKPLLSSSLNPVTAKDQRSNSFYQDKKKQEELQQTKTHSAEPRKSKKLEAAVKRKPNTPKTYNHIDGIRRKENQLPPFDAPKTVVKDFDRICAFSVNTHQGTVRAYNEDRVSILLNAQQRYENLVNIQVKSCSMFAIYDGHGGADCCNFLKDHLHAYVLNNYNERDVRGSIKTACHKLDQDFFKKARSDSHCDTSGSCALVLFVIGIVKLTQDNNLIFVNVGDSRAILSKNDGGELQICTYDHKPQFFGEMQRIFKAGGQLYR